MKQFDILYKRTKTGSIQQYIIYVDESSKTTDGNPVIVKETGKLGGKLTVHTETIFEGKNISKTNETTPDQQAFLQADSDWKRKKDEGYKSLIDLGYDVIGARAGEQPSENMYKILDKVLPQFNTDSNGNVKPMLATDLSKIKKIEYPVFLQPKLDGVRCLMIVRFNVGIEKPIMFLSRSGKEYTTLDHISKDIGNYCFTKGEMPIEFILDGEIYSDELTFQEITQAVKKQQPKSLKLKFRAYDIVNDAPQHARKDMVFDLVKRINSSNIIPVLTITASTKDDVKYHHDKWVQEGYEGAMIRLYNGKYAQGQRSRDLIKVKEFDENEFEFLRFEKGLRDEDLIAVCKTSTGKEFKAKMTGNKQHKQNLFENESQLVGCPLTVKYFGYTDEGSIRFPIGKIFRNYE